MNAAQINDQLMPRRAPRVGLGAAAVTLQPCYKFSLDLNLQGATTADVAASFAASLPTWASRVRNLYVGSFGSSTTLTGTWIGTAPFTVPASIPVSHNFGGYTGFATVQVLVTGGTIGALDTAAGCVPLPPTCPPGTHWDGNACVAQVVLKQPAPAPTPVTVFHQVPISTGYTGGTSTGGSSSTSSSKTPYYVAGAGALALAAGAAYWKYGRKRR